MKSEFQRFVKDIHNQLLQAHPVEIEFNHPTHRKCAQDNQKKLAELVVDGTNIYAIWIKKSDAKSWKPVYVGQRTTGKLLERINQHLFHTPKGTQSKLNNVESARKSGHSIGITMAKVDPDPLRLSVEDQVIFLATTTKDALPWNRRSRQVSR